MRALLERSEARVYLDARKDGVRLPAHLRTEPQLRLDYSYSFHPPIADLSVEDGGIGATLSFNQRPQQTFIPWHAVYLIADYDGNGAVWQDDIPGEVLERVAAALDKQPMDDALGGDGDLKPPATASTPPAPSRPKLGLVPEGEAPLPPSVTTASPQHTATSDLIPPPDPETPRPRPALRLVK